jgi:IS5 family transposase
MRPKRQKKADHDEQVAPYFSDEGRPAEPVRFIIGMFILKHTFALSDEVLWERWVESPYFQYFTGESLDMDLP